MALEARLRDESTQSRHKSNRTQVQAADAARKCNTPSALLVESGGRGIDTSGGIGAAHGGVARQMVVELQTGIEVAGGRKPPDHKQIAPNTP